MISEVARAKVNLCLHVTGRRDDGMHLLDSIVVFPKVGDVLTAAHSDNISLEVDGPFGTDISGDNLILRAVELIGGKADLQLAKNLPVASGIGGGSANAAAAIRLLANLSGHQIPSIADIAKLGADVPVCIAQNPVRMQGIGDILSPALDIPKFWIVLVNAGEAVETRQIFRKLKNCENPEIGALKNTYTTDDFFDFLALQRNDMQDAAIEISPIIADILTAIEGTSNCKLSRMSGSGGTCFGLYYSETEAAQAASNILSKKPDWWVVSAEV